NAGNYRAMVALPSFELFPWFFVIPGVLLAIVGAAGLAARRLRAPARWTALAVGVALLVAPFALGIFGAAPKGGRMMSAFETLETRKKVETMQGYFSSVAVGQGALRIDVVPALREQGLSAAQVAARFPALTTLDERWVPILNDLTPMIGTMSDNVDNYQAIAALPPFPLFPWFFIVPGLLVAALALGPRARFTRAYLPVRNKEPVT
ncbi:MAG: hypothetical protein QOG42_142, partial [Solirubrobacteraceae bacterium]|nr:hypothetical protein [Solirubrobacteraceae bacterium]